MEEDLILRASSQKLGPHFPGRGEDNVSNARESIPNR